MHADMEDLKTFAGNAGAAEANQLTHWDITFWSERLRESKYDINEVCLRCPLFIACLPLFPLFVQVTTISCCNLINL